MQFKKKKHFFKNVSCCTFLLNKQESTILMLYNFFWIVNDEINISTIWSDNKVELGNVMI